MRTTRHSDAFADDVMDLYSYIKPNLKDKTPYIFKSVEPAPRKAQNNVIWQDTTVSRTLREAQNGHRSINLWFTGLSGSGKSTMANAVEERLHKMGYRTFLLDGDNVRHGLCSDLGFDLPDRSENIRRVAEIVKLFLESGVIILTTFISPREEDRQRVRRIVSKENFVEVYCRCPFEICEKRDVKGLYKLAKAGKINNFTGFSSPYEEPADADLVLDSADEPLKECVNTILYHLKKRGVITFRDVNGNMKN